MKAPRITPRITGHQLFYLQGMKNFEIGNKRPGACYVNAKSWTNSKGKLVWSFFVRRLPEPLKGDSWDTVTGASLLKKGLIEPAYTIKHDGSYEKWPDSEITVYRLTELGNSVLN